MAKKIKVRTIILSGAALALCIILCCTLDAGAQPFKARKVTFTISGSVGLSEVVMKGLPGEPVTDEDGSYSTTVEYGFSGTVTPTKEGYTFEPANRTYGKVTGNLDNQDYTATLITLTVSGTTGMAGVVMNGLPGEPVTDANGAYSATVNYSFSSTVRPTKEGYSFKPANRTYDPVKRDMKNQNYAGALITFDISGTTGMTGVAMNGLPGNPVTGVGGIYNATIDYGWSGTVTPRKEGYIFDPPEQQYSDVTGGQFNQNYAAKLLTFTISGTTGMEGVVMSGLPSNPVTGADGTYTAIVDYGWSGKVTPAKDGCTFEPANRIYDKVTTNQGNQGYSATLLTFTISGTTGMPGVVMSGLPGNPVTGTDGTYSATVNYGFSGTVTPTKEGYTFEPANRIYDPVSGKQMNQNYTGAMITFTISGRAGVVGAVMNGLPGNPVVGVDGTYSATVNYGFSSTVTPTREGYIFEPANRQYSDVTGGQTNQNYSATLITLTISGTATSDGRVLEGVSVSADKGGGSGMTNAEGRYEVLVDYGWRGTVTPSKEGYTFKPANKIYDPVTKDQTNQGFAAKLLTFTISGAIVIGDTPIEGVLVSAEGAGSDTTDAEGKYSVTVPYGWSGMVVPTKEGYIFEPPNKTYTNVTRNITEEGEPREAPERKVPEAEVKPEAEAEVKPEAEPEAEPEVKPEAEVDKFEIERRALEEEIAGLREEVEEFSRPAPEEPPVVSDILEEQPLVTNVFFDTDLREALQDIASQVGVTIIPDETIAGMITCEIKDVPLDRALEIVLAGTGFVIKKTSHYYLICSPDPKGAAFPAVSETRLIKLNYIEAPAALKLLSVGLRQYAEADAAAGTVCVTAPRALMNRIVSDLKSIDQPPRHVMLDGRIVVMERGNLLNLGIKWGWPRIRAGVFSNSDLHGGGAQPAGGKWPWGIQIGYSPDALFTNALELMVNLLEENGEATIVSKPNVLAQDGKEAEIKVITEEYYMMTTSPEAAWYTRAELEKIESGTVLKITPRIGENNDITLEMSIEVSDSIPTGRASDLPVVTRRSTKNTVRIKDGGTVAVAGLTENRIRLDKTKTPGLGEIPLLGGLFRNTRSEKFSQEVAVFITARLIPESEVLTELAELPINKTPDEPVKEDEFKKSLKESLSRPSK